jgi:hypothetical protein
MAITFLSTSEVAARTAIPSDEERRNRQALISDIAGTCDRGSLPWRDAAVLVDGFTFDQINRSWLAFHALSKTWDVLTTKEMRLAFGFILRASRWV